VPFFVQSALDKLKNIKAGRLVLNAAKTPIITSVTEEQKGIYKQLKLSFPNINRLQ
jgi:predicted alpha/beta-fold hydrolase